jgi:hypothetical protein
MEEMLVRVDVDAAHDPRGDPSEVRVEMKQEMDSGGEQEHAAQRALDRDKANDQPRASRIAGTHRQS